MVHLLDTDLEELVLVLFHWLFSLSPKKALITS